MEEKTVLDHSETQGDTRRSVALKPALTVAAFGAAIGMRPTDALAAKKKGDSQEHIKFKYDRTKIKGEPQMRAKHKNQQ